jgi:hypothetical protein
MREVRTITRDTFGLSPRHERLEHQHRATRGHLPQDLDGLPEALPERELELAVVPVEASQDIPSLDMKRSTNSRRAASDTPIPRYRNSVPSGISQVTIYFLVKT